MKKKKLKIKVHFPIMKTIQNKLFKHLTKDNNYYKDERK